MFLSLSFFCLASLAQEDIPDYRSTFNTGLGKQQRLNAVEDQLMILTRTQKSDQKKLYEQLPSEEEFKQMSRDLKTSHDEIKQLNQKVELLEQKNAEFQEKLERVDGAELSELIGFIRPLKEGGLDKMKQEVEGLKLTIRSMEAVIESINNKTP
jgi:hypothetical protein